MTATRSTITVILTIAAATLLFWAMLHQISSVWLDVALRPEVRDALAQSMEDQKKLRGLDPERREEYRRRFDATRKLLNRIDVIRMNREAMLRRFELALTIVFASAAVIAAVSLSIRYRRAQERERRQYLDRVSVLQETARRHAHEIKGPLTAARLEMERFADLARGPASADELARAHQSVGEELDRLARFTREYSTFGGLGQPVLRRESLGDMIEEFCATFAEAWPGMALLVAAGSQRVEVCMDRDMLRQVFVNLCTNSAKAGAKRVTFVVIRGARVALDVRDDGMGIAEPMRARIFDPYVTTRKIGEGMGLGLSISRKVLLDHGGDLQLLDTTADGTTFRLTFGDRTCS